VLSIPTNHTVRLDAIHHHNTYIVAVFGELGIISPTNRRLLDPWQ